MRCRRWGNRRPHGRTPPPATAAGTSSLVSWAANVTLMRPDSGQRDGPHRREGFGHQIVDVVEHVRGEQTELDGSLPPARAEIQHFHRHPAGIDKSFQLDALWPTCESEVRADFTRADDIV